MNDKQNIEASVRPGTEVDRSKSKVNKLRLLDFDDLILLQHLLEGNTIAATAKKMGLTQPAVTQRVRKIERVFDEPILQKVGRYVRLTKLGRSVCAKAADALSLMRDVYGHEAGTSLTIGVDPDMAPMLWLALSDLRTANPTATYNCQIGTPEEIAGLFEDGRVDACLTSAKHVTGVFGSAEIMDEQRLFVAAPQVAALINSPADLASHTFLDVDKAFPSLMMVDAAIRPAMNFQNVWTLGSVNLVVAALLRGYGVAIVPERAVLNAMSVGKLVQILPEIKINPDSVQLLYSQDRSLQEAFLKLADILKLQAST